MVVTALSEWKRCDNDFNQTAQLLHLHYDTESCQKAGQLDAVLKVASQVARPCVFVNAGVCLNVHAWASTASTAGYCEHVNRHFALFSVTTTDALFTQTSMTQKEEALVHMSVHFVHIYT